MAVISMKDLLEAGVHFGHQTRRWNPKMERFIFCERNGIYILDLQKTAQNIIAAYRFCKNLASQGGSVLFVGTKKQAKSIVESYATQAEMSYVNERWLGGMLTNFKTIQKSTQKLEDLQNLEHDERSIKLTKKELGMLKKKRSKIERYLKGVASMTTLPSAIFVIDSKKEEIAIAEAKKLKIPIIAIVDTIGDPDGINYCIPGNDDAIKSIELITRTITQALQEGRAEWLKKSLEAGAPALKEAQPKSAVSTVQAAAALTEPAMSSDAADEADTEEEIDPSEDLEERLETVITKKERIKEKINDVD